MECFKNSCMKCPQHILTEDAGGHPKEMAGSKMAIWNIRGKVLRLLTDGCYTSTTDHSRSGDQEEEKRERSLDNNSYVEEYDCSSLALD
ncbi:hypothetical protein Tco_0014994 [Tanacetum coccineum]